MSVATLLRDGAGRVGACLACVLALSGCAAPPAPPKAPIRVAPAAPSASAVPADPLATPPPAGAASDTPFPAISHAQLDNGLELRVVTRKSYPLVELSLLVLSGVASDGATPGVASLAGELMKEGGAGRFDTEALSKQADSLGARLDVTTGRDSTRISMGVTTSDFEAALDLVGAVAQAPRFAPLEFDKLKQRELEQVQNEAKGSAEWAASMVLYRKLFALETGSHPYSHFDATPSELERLTLADCKRWYQTNVTPANAVLVVAGDVDPARVEAAAKRVFSAWQGVRPASVAYPMPVMPRERVVWLVDRPHSAQSEVYVAALGPSRSSPEWPALAAGNQILGGGVAGRLFRDVREKRSLAYHTGSSLEEPAHGPVPIVLSAGTQAAKTDLTLQALLENLDKIAQAPPTAAEVAMASRSLSNGLLFRTETLADVANLTSKLAVLGFADGYFDDYRHALARLDPAAVFDADERYYRVGIPVIVVAGDASVVAKPLSRFGMVEILDPQNDFASIRKVGQEGNIPVAPGAE